VASSSRRRPQPKASAKPSASRTAKPAPGRNGASAVPPKAKKGAGKAPPASSISWTTPGAGPVRQRVESASRAFLVRLHDLPRWVLLVVVAALAIGGAALPGWPGAICLAVVTVFVGWLLYLAWPSLPTSRRLTRLFVLALLVLATVARAVAG
jgi:hypothetical protein